MPIIDKNQIVDDSTIWGIDADEKTGREENAEIKNERGREGHREDKAPDKAAEQTSNESRDAQDISAKESRRKS